MTNDELYELVPVGRENARPLSYFVRLSSIGLSSMTGREIRKAFGRLNENEKPVCNLGGGYFRPKTVEELEEYRRFINAYICKLLKKEYRIKKAMRHFGISPIA